MAIRPSRRILGQSWLTAPTVACPIGAGLIKVGHGSSLAVLVVGVAPFVIIGLLCCLWGLAFLNAVRHYRRTGESQQEFITIASNALVSILTLTPGELPCRSIHLASAALPNQRTR